MKSIYIFIILILSATGVQAQWSQLGDDIDGEASNDKSGNSTSISEDGFTVAIGASFNDDGGIDAGQVRVFEWDGSEWIQKGDDIDGAAAGDHFGNMISLSSNGDILAVGAPLNDDVATDLGQVQIYEWDGTTWIQKGTNLNGEATGGEAGTSVGLSSDGNTVVVGEPFNNGNGSYSGHARIYEWDGSEWLQKGSDIDGEAASDWSGSSVEISDDGLIVAVGAPLNNGAGTASGHVRIYYWNGVSWIQRGTDINGEDTFDASGKLPETLSLSSDGNIVAIGAPENDGNGSRSGHTRVYEWDGSTWDQKGVDIDGEAADDWSGSSVSLSGDGNRLAIGAPYNDENGSNAGHVRIYDWDGSSWQLNDNEIDSENSGDWFGFSVSLNTIADFLCAGAPQNNGGLTNNGHVRVYSAPLCHTTQTLDTISCDSYTVPSGDETHTSTGVYFDTIPNMEACDSVITINLTINNSNTGTETIIACDSYTWAANGTTYMSSTTDEAVLTNVDGCDSTVTLNLTINNSNTGAETITACDSYFWAANGTTYTSTTTDEAVLTNIDGCDSTVTLNLTINNSNTGTETITACDSYFWEANGTTYTSTTTDEAVLTNIDGCDSTVTLNLTINNSNTGTETTTACDGYFWEANGTTYTSTTTDIAVLTNIDGCDSTVTLNLTINTIDNGVTQSGSNLTADESGATYQWLDCPEMTTIDGATNQSFSALSNGDYAVIVNKDGCSDTSACYAVTGIGIYENNFGNKLLLYPNPTQGDFAIDFGETYSVVQITMTDLNGKLIQSKTFNGSQILNLKLEEPAGVYLLIIESGDQNAVIRLVKE